MYSKSTNNGNFSFDEEKKNENKKAFKIAVGTPGIRPRMEFEISEKNNVDFH